MVDVSSRPNVALFVTCLVDLFRPSVGFAAVKLLEQAGCEVAVPRGQTCCGQPAYNSGDRADTTEIARRTIPALLPFDYVVAPSGSCAGMIRKHWPALFENEQKMSKLAISVAEKNLGTDLVPDRCLRHGDSGRGIWRRCSLS